MEREKITYENLLKANELIKTTDIKGKDYAEVNQRIKAFRMVYPQGTIETEMTSNENGVCIFKAKIFNEYGELLSTGTAYEKENSTFINKTSYIENCETSAVGRALGMAGFGIDASVSSAEEVQNAIINQNEPITKEQAELITLDFGKYNGKTLKQVLEADNKYMHWLAESEKANQGLKNAVNILLEEMEKKKKEKQSQISDYRKELIKYCKEKGKDMEELAVIYNLTKDSTNEDFKKALEVMQGE